MTALESTAA